MKDKIRIVTILLLLESPLQLLSQNIIPQQNVVPIANFAWDENDTSRYEGHYLYEQAYEMIEDMLMGRRTISSIRMVKWCITATLPVDYSKPLRG